VKPFDFELFMKVMRVVAYELSDNDLDLFVRDRIKQCIDNNPTPAQLYDCMDWVSKQQCDRIRLEGLRLDIGYISGFTQSLCDVTKHYERPSE